MTQRQLFAVVFFAVLAVLLYQIAIIFRPFLMPLFWAMVLAHITFPAHERLTQELRGRATLSAALLTVMILILCIVPVVMLTVVLIQEATTAYDQIDAWVKAGGLKTVPAMLERLPFGASRLQPLLGRLIVSQADVQNAVLQNVRGLSAFLLSQLTDLAANAFFVIANFLVMMFALFFFFRDGRRMYAQLYRIVPLDDAHKAKIFARLDVTVTAVVKGLLITALIQGALAGMAYAVLEVPFPVFLMGLTTLLAPLPVGGTSLVWGPVTIYLFLTEPFWKSVAMAAWGVGVVTMADNVVRPWLIGKDAQL
ncbi:MAG TPA: AI-2E family transporter, partial [Nitrospirales bacterium]|nr:AI-2E family transporter [Nitrospirales bacterium]